MVSAAACSPSHKTEYLWGDVGMPCFERPIFGLLRSGFPESVIYGASFFKRQTRHPEGSGAQVIITQALLKPWQFLALDLAQADSIWAVALGCHTAQDIHFDALNQLSLLSHANEDELICPRILPLRKNSSSVHGQGLRPSRFANPCSGKHLMMLAACDRYEFRRKDYWHEDHPLQKKIFSYVGRTSNAAIRWLKDDCGLPTALIGVDGLMDMWERLALDQSPGAVSMKTIWGEQPVLLGGPNRLTTELLTAFSGKILVKESGNHLIMVQSLPEGNQEVAGILLKLASCDSQNHLALGLYATLQHQKNLPPIFEDILTYLEHRLEDWIPANRSLWLP